MRQGGKSDAEAVENFLPFVFFFPATCLHTHACVLPACGKEGLRRGRKKGVDAFPPLLGLTFPPIFHLQTDREEKAVRRMGGLTEKGGRKEEGEGEEKEGGGGGGCCVGGKEACWRRGGLICLPLPPSLLPSPVPSHMNVWCGMVVPILPSQPVCNSLHYHTLRTCLPLCPHYILPIPGRRSNSCVLPYIPSYHGKIVWEE